MIVIRFVYLLLTKTKTRVRQQLGLDANRYTSAD